MCNICLWNIWPLTVTLTLSWHMGNMGSAHPLVEVNVSFKFEVNPFISKGVIERTRIGDGRTDQPTRQSEPSLAPPPHFVVGVDFFIKKNHHCMHRYYNVRVYFMITVIMFCFFPKLNDFLWDFLSWNNMYSRGAKYCNFTNKTLIMQDKLRVDRL